MKLTKAQAKPILDQTFPEYSGRKFNLEFKPKITFWDTNWSGGTRNEYRFLRADGKTFELPVGAPWANPVEGKSVDIPMNALVVCHTYFCGKDMGIRIYANPAYQPKWLNG